MALGTSCFSRAFAQAPVQTVSVAMLAPSALVWVHAVAQEEGFYAQHNIAVRELRASNSPTLLQAVASGSADAGISLGDLALRAIDHGASIIIAGAFLDKSALRLYGGKGITTVPELDGKNVTAGAVRGGTADLLRYMLLINGGHPKSVRMLSIANSRDRLTALENGAISGALLLAPFDALAAQKGYKQLAILREPYVETPLILNKKWVSTHRKTAIAFVAALKEAAAWMNNPANRTKTVEDLAKYTGLPTAICENAYNFLILQQKAIPPNLAVSDAGLENIEKIDKVINGSSANWPPFVLSRYYDPSLLTAP